MKTATTMIIVALGLFWTFDSNSQGISGRPPLVGRIFFASTDWTPGENYGPQRRLLGVMDADGRSRKILTARFNGIVSFAWNSNLSVLTIANSSTDISNDGWFNLKIEGDGALNSTVTSITPTLSRDLDNFFSESSGNPENSQAGTSSNRRWLSTRVTISPDGSKVAGLAILQPSKDWNGELRLCIADLAIGSSSKKCVMSFVACSTRSPVWSPDGRYIVITGALPENLISCNMAELYLYDNATNSALRLTDVRGPKLDSSDRRAIVKPGADIDHRHHSSQPAWSPDGKWIMFVSYGRIFRIRPDGSNSELIVRNGIFPTWSPDSSMIMYLVPQAWPFFGARSPRGGRMVVADSNGKNAREIPLPKEFEESIYYLQWTQ